MRFRPTVEEERWQRVAALAGASDLTRAHDGGWRSYSILGRIGFFFLGAICAGALWGFIELLSSSTTSAAFVAGAICLGVAEFLILTYRWYHAGMEEALFAGGVLMLALAMSSDHERFLVCGIAMLVAALRLLNPLLLVTAALLFSGAMDSQLRPFYCAAVAVTALVLLPIRIERPSYDSMLAALVIVMPVAAYVFAKDGHFVVDFGVAIALLLYAALSLAIGLRFRIHAPLIALFVALGAFAYEVRDVSGLRLETRLIVWGSVLLVVAVLIERALRVPRYGITSEKLRDDNVFGLLELAGAAILTPRAKPPEASAQLHPGGGGYGGGGASGDF